MTSLHVSRPLARRPIRLDRSLPAEAWCGPAENGLPLQLASGRIRQLRTSLPDLSRRRIPAAQPTACGCCCILAAAEPWLG